jgi:DNA-binding transcriptional LysR family regulator
MPPTGQPDARLAKAAPVAGRSQPRIKALEEQAGMPLLYREARRAPTPAGEAFLHHARGMLQSEQLRHDLQEYGAGLRGHVRVFANTTAVTDFHARDPAAFLADHPRINVDLQERPNAEIAAACWTAAPTWASWPARWTRWACRPSTSAPTGWCW